MPSGFGIVKMEGGETWHLVFYNPLTKKQKLVSETDFAVLQAQIEEERHLEELRRRAMNPRYLK